MPTPQIERMQAFIASKPGLLPRGGRSKTALTPPTGSQILDVSELAGLLEYSPSEYTFTALAGTSLAEIDQALANNGQFLPFDPPFSSYRTWSLVASRDAVLSSISSAYSMPFRA